jgi:hypothetical protein
MIVPKPFPTPAQDLPTEISFLGLRDRYSTHGRATIPDPTTRILIEAIIYDMGDEICWGGKNKKSEGGKRKKSNRVLGSFLS